MLIAMIVFALLFVAMLSSLWVMDARDERARLHRVELGEHSPLARPAPEPAPALAPAPAAVPVVVAGAMGRVQVA